MLPRTSAARRHGCARRRRRSARGPRRRRRCATANTAPGDAGTPSGQRHPRHQRAVAQPSSRGTSSAEASLGAAQMTRPSSTTRPRAPSAGRDPAPVAAQISERALAAARRPRPPAPAATFTLCRRDRVGEVVGDEQRAAAGPASDSCGWKDAPPDTSPAARRAGGRALVFSAPHLARKPAVVARDERRVGVRHRLVARAARVRVQGRPRRAGPPPAGPGTTVVEHIGRSAGAEGAKAPRAGRCRNAPAMQHEAAALP